MPCPVWTLGPQQAPLLHLQPQRNITHASSHIMHSVLWAKTAHVGTCSPSVCHGLRRQKGTPSPTTASFFLVPYTLAQQALPLFRELIKWWAMGY